VPFAGVILVAIATSAGRHPSLAGVLLCLLAAVSYALAVVSQKPALRHAPALQVTTFGCAMGALACLPFTGQLATAPLTATLSAAYLGVFPTAVAFTTWAYALSRTSASMMGATTYLVPALTVLMPWAILGQVPGWLALAGGTASRSPGGGPAPRNAAAPWWGNPVRARRPHKPPIWPRAELLAARPPRRYADRHTMRPRRVQVGVKTRERWRASGVPKIPSKVPINSPHCPTCLQPL